MELASILQNSSHKFRREILAMPVATLKQSVLAHMTLRTGVHGKETVGAMKSDAQLRPYKSEKGATDTFSIRARTLETFLGDVVEEFDLNILYTTVYGESFSSHTNRTEGQIVKDLSLQMSKSVSKNLAKACFSGVRNANGTTTTALFDGFDTIAAAEITAGNISIAKNNLYEYSGNITSSNAGDILKAIYDAAIDELVESENLKMFVPRSVKKAYDDWFLDNFGAVQYNKEFSRKYLHGTEDAPCEIVALSAQKDSPYIYLTTKANMLIGCDQKSEEEKVLIRQADNPKTTQFFMCLFWGVQFQMIEPEYLLVARKAADSPAPAVTISGATVIESAATSGNNERTYATSDGSSVTAAVTTEGANWLSVAASGNKVIFTRQAYAYSSSEGAANPRTATVRISSGTAHLDVTFKQAMAAQE